MQDPRVLEAVDFVRGLMWDHNVLLNPTGDTSSYTVLSETVGMWGAGRWPANSYQQNEFETYDIQHWPRNRDQRTVWGGGAHGISSVTQHPEEAWEFIKWVNSVYVVDHVTRLGTSMPSRRSVALSDAISHPPSAAVYYEALEGIVAVPSPPEYPQLHSTFIEELAKVWRAEVDPGTAVEEIHRRFNVILGAE
jgi:ABC-type glycerol-3-phosphate transport system substrate-binding protein